MATVNVYSTTANESVYVVVTEGAFIPVSVGEGDSKEDAIANAYEVNKLGKHVRGDSGREMDILAEEFGLNPHTLMQEDDEIPSFMTND
jgi:hypothetical protein